jgi:hypothetical protein
VTRPAPRHPPTARRPRIPLRPDAGPSLVAVVALRLPLAGVSALLLAASAALLDRLSTWAPGPAPESATPAVRLRALLTVAGALVCFLGAVVVARLLA